LSSLELRGQATQFIESVLALKPAIAVFDCDGTLWSGDAGADFFYWEINRGLVSREVGEWARARYKEYEAGRVGEEQMCGEMVTMNRGLSQEALQRAAAEFYQEVVTQREFPELHELIRRLAAQGCDNWAVSSTNNWVVEVGAERFGIARAHVLAACVELEHGCLSDRLIRVPTDELKAVAIREVIRKPVDAAFGNSVHDQAMMEMVARRQGWPVYWPVGS
jgi:phosphoserine phosphatase